MKEHMLLESIMITADKGNGLFGKKEKEKEMKERKNKRD